MDEKMISDVIARVGGNKRFLDFRNGLIPASPDNYAMLRTAGGKYGVMSGIDCYITDYSVKPTRTVSARMPVHIFSELETVCLKNTGTNNGYTSTEKNLGFAFSVMNEQLTRVGYTVSNLMALSTKWFGKFFTEETVDGKKQTHITRRPDGTSLLTFMNTLLSHVYKGVYENSELPIPEFPFPEPQTDYRYSQTRVNPHRHLEGGYAPVTLCTVTRQGYIVTQAGEIERKKAPWTIEIQAFEARPVTSERGTVQYESSTVRNKTVCTSVLTDTEMLRCCAAVKEFISVWDMAFAVPLVRAGVEEQEAKRKAARLSGGSPYAERDDSEPAEADEPEE